MAKSVFHALIRPGQVDQQLPRPSLVLSRELHRNLSMEVTPAPAPARKGNFLGALWAPQALERVFDVHPIHGHVVDLNGKRDEGQEEQEQEQETPHLKQDVAHTDLV